MYVHTMHACNNSLSRVQHCPGDSDFELERGSQIRDVENEGFTGQEGGDNILLELLQVEERCSGGGCGERHSDSLGWGGGEGRVGVEDVPVTTAQELN